jgi:hypothetical protein
MDFRKTGGYEGCGGLTLRPLPSDAAGSRAPEQTVRLVGKIVHETYGEGTSHQGATKIRIKSADGEAATLVGIQDWIPKSQILGETDLDDDETEFIVKKKCIDGLREKFAGTGNGPATGPANGEASGMGHCDPAQDPPPANPDNGHGAGANAPAAARDTTPVKVSGLTIVDETGYQLMVKKPGSGGDAFPVNLTGVISRTQRDDGLWDLVVHEATAKRCMLGPFEVPF